MTRARGNEDDDASPEGDDFAPTDSRKTAAALKWGLVGGGAAALLVGLWVLFRAVGDAGKIPAEIVTAAAPAVGRLHIIDIRGNATPHDNAFAIDNGVMLTTCRGFRPNTQAVVKFGPQRTAPATVSRSNPKRNLCRLAVVGAGSWPLGVHAGAPEAGSKAYAVSTGPAGETVLVAVKVRGTVAIDGGNAIELANPVDPAQAGGPLLDAQGRVIGVLAAPNAYPGKNVALPASWVQEIRAAPSTATR